MGFGVRSKNWEKPQNTKLPAGAGNVKCIMNRVWNRHQNPFGTSTVHPFELQAAILGHPVVTVTHHHSHVWNSFSVGSTSVPSNRFGIQPRTMIFFRTKKSSDLSANPSRQFTCICCTPWCFPQLYRRMRIQCYHANGQRTAQGVELSRHIPWQPKVPARLYLFLIAGEKNCWVWWGYCGYKPKLGISWHIEY